MTPASILLRLLASATLIAVLGVTPPASAHAGLVEATPAGGSVVTSLPSEVVLTFSEAVSDPAYIVVTGPDGQRVTDGPVRVADAVVTATLRADDPPVEGAYTVAYRVVSEDGHPVAGELTFTVGDEAVPATDDVADPQDDRSPVPWMIGGGLLLLAGGLAFLALRRSRE